MITPSANITRTIGGGAPPPEAGGLAAGGPAAQRERGGERHQHRGGGGEQRDVPSPALGQRAHHQQAAEHAQHPRELEGVEAERGARAGLILEHRGKAADHHQGVSEPGEDSPQHQDRQRARGGEHQRAGEQGHRREGQGDREAVRRERAHRQIGGHAREPEGAREHSELPVGQALGAGDVGQERAEGADADRAREDHEAQQGRARESILAHPGRRLRARMDARATTDRRTACPRSRAG
jgi:hypothetical protein